MSFVRELFAYLVSQKKFWLIPLIMLFPLVGVLFVRRPGVGRGAIHLHAVLSAAT